MVLCSTKEEVGGQGAQVSAYALEPTEAIAVDVSFAKQPDAESMLTAELGKGPMIGFSAALDRKISKKLVELAKRENIPYQLEAMGGRTGTNCDEISTTRGGVRTGLIIPCRSATCTPRRRSAILRIWRTSQSSSRRISRIRRRSRMLNYEILEKLTRTIGVSGEEDDVRSVILSEIEPYADEIHISPLGNILAFKKGEKRPEKKLMLCAHMDEVGFVITNITENGLLKFTTVGNIRPEVLSGRDVLVGGKTPGVICAKPVHLLKGDEFEKPVPVNELAIDIGADTREQAETLVQIGDNACFVPFFEHVHGTVKAKALDDRVGCFALITLMQRPLEYDTYFVFSTQEEIGLRGAGTAAYILEPDAALVLEGTTAGDIPGVSPTDAACKMGGGAVISLTDMRTVYPKDYFRRAMALGKENNIPVQPKTVRAGGTDAGTIHVSRGGVKTLTISHPCRYIHSAIAMTTEKDIEAVIDLMVLMMAEISGGKL